MADFPLVVNDVLGLKFKVVRGYEGTPQINHAIERGEIQGQGGIGWAAVKAQVPQWIAEKKIKVIAQYGLKRHPDLADVPSMLELAVNEPDRQALAIDARPSAGRVLAGAGRAGAGLGTERRADCAGREPEWSPDHGGHRRRGQQPRPEA